MRLALPEKPPAACPTKGIGHEICDARDTRDTHSAPNPYLASGCPLLAARVLLHRYEFLNSIQEKNKSHHKVNATPPPAAATMARVAQEMAAKEEEQGKEQEHWDAESSARRDR